jgi:hypothetical protein
MQNNNAKIREFECELEDGTTIYFEVNPEEKTASITHIDVAPDSNSVVRHSVCGCYSLYGYCYWRWGF